MKKLVFIISFFLIGLPSYAFFPIHLNITLKPKYSGVGVVPYDCLDAFIDLHKQLTVEETSMTGEVGVSKVEMDGIKDNGSLYSSHEQLWEKRLKDGQHYAQLLAMITSIGIDVAKCYSRYESFKERIEQKVKQSPEVLVMWSQTSKLISDDVGRAKYLVGLTAAGALSLTRSTSEEKFRMLNEIRTIISHVDHLISSLERNLEGVGRKVNFDVKPTFNPARAGYNEWGEFNNNWF